ncbi:amidohydrolase family protein [Ferrimonas marina]|uniref:Imidazolonepropionase n=1 Tax=Ferrimonas marina TaxID=299255 RepID=A0A1M5VPE0_9GAMM|nr:hypothetical protein [Ferrimonas marina]SHH76783.1 Imidazolonepropionase [Ferrimonas marina]
MIRRLVTLLLLPGLLLVCLLLPGMVAAQTTAAKALLLKGATIHSPNGPLAEHDLLMVDGRIQAIGQDLAIPPNAEVHELQGQHLYPPLVALISQVGLREIGMVRSTVDTWEVGAVNPQLQAAVAFNPDTEVLPTLRANGIGYAQLTPEGSALAGRSSLIHLSGWNLGQSLVKADTGLHLYWPDPRLPIGDEEARNEALADYREAHQGILQAFEDAQRYQRARTVDPTLPTDTRWEAMAPLLEGRVPLFVHADDQRQIRHALDLLQRYNLKGVLVGGYDAYLVSAALLEADVAVIYTHANSLPLRPDDPYDLPFQIPAMLHQSGLSMALAYPGSWDSRNLAFAAGQAVAFGLPREVALAAITQVPAQLLGVPALGKLEVGAPASLIISKGDLLDMGQAGVSAMYLEGKKVDLDNRHSRLYRKYKERN